MTWQMNRLNALFGLIAWIGIVQFAIVVGWAILHYPGGYRFTEYFLSDLGRSRAPGGQDNSVCAALFSQSVVGLGISLMPFFIVIPTTFESRRWTLCGSGLLSAAGLIGIGLTPYDDYFILHNVALGIWIAPMLIMVGTFLQAVRSEEAASTSLVFYGSLGVVVASLAYALAGDHRGHVIMQKLMVCLAVFWFLAVFVTVSVSTVYAVTSRKAIAEAQARRYLALMETGRWRRR